MKFIFLSVEELNNVATTLTSSIGTKVQSKVTYSEELDTDVVEVYTEGNNKATEVIAMIDFLPEIEKHLNQSISSYDVMEVGDLGVGFLFFF